MKRRLLLTFALLLALPAPALADPFGELPFQPTRGTATGLRASGVPGEVMAFTEKELFADHELIVLRADAGGLAAIQSMGIDFGAGDQAVAGQPNGAAVVAIRAKRSVAAMVREPGGQFGALAPLSTGDERDDLFDAVGAVVAPSGETVVVVEQRRPAADEAEDSLVDDDARLIAFRRAPGGGFDQGQAITPWSSGPNVWDFNAAADGDGRFTLAFTTHGHAGEELNVTTASPGEPFRPAEVVGREQWVIASSLAVAADGRALLAFGSLRNIKIAERAPGEDRFGAPVLVDSGLTSNFAISASVGVGGAAAVAWRRWTGKRREARAVVRSAAGVLGPAFDLAPATPGDEIDDLGITATLDGPRYVITWLDPDEPQVKMAAGALTGGPVERSMLGAPLRPVASQAPVRLQDGRLAIAWLDNDESSDALPSGRGRVHLAAPGLAEVMVPPPHVSFPRQRRRRLRSHQTFTVPVRCAAACDVRADLRWPSGATTTRRLDRGGLLRLRFGVLPLWSGKLGRRTATIRVRVGAPGSRATTTYRVRVPLTLIASPPMPKVRNVVGRPAGDDLIVSWTTSIPARGTRFLLVGIAKDGSIVGIGTRQGLGHRRFTVRLPDAADVRAVRFRIFGALDQRTRVVTVPVAR